MRKREFLLKLEESLNGFSGAEIQKVLGYYDELISDRVESGDTEQEAVESLGEIKNISLQIRAELAEERLTYVKKEKEPKKEKRGRHKNAVPEYEADRKYQRPEDRAYFQSAPPAAKPPEFTSGYRPLDERADSRTNTGYQPDPRGSGYRPNDDRTAAYARYNYQPGGYSGDYRGEYRQQPYYAEPQKKKGTFVLVMRLFLTPALLPVGIVYFALFFALAVTLFSLVVSFGAAAVALSVACIPAAVFVGIQGGAGLALIAGGGLLITAAVFMLLTSLVATVSKGLLRGTLRGGTSMVKAIYGGNKK